MNIRHALPSDQQACLSIDVSYLTDHVWQMEQNATATEIVTGFRTIRLPRPMRIRPPQDPSWMFKDWEQRGFFVLAEEEGEVVGYLYLQADSELQIGWISFLAVSAEKRGRGIGTDLIQEAKRWAKSRRLRALMMAVQTRNYPAIRFCQKSQFTFCGYNDHYYPRDIALFFNCGLD